MSIEGQDTHHAEAAGEPLGTRLRQGRQALGLSTAEVGIRLRLPAAIVEAMEREDFERLGAPIYARSHLGGYVRMLGLPSALVDCALAVNAPPPPQLVTTTSVPRSHYLFDRYARRAVYAVLTASIVLPVVWLATRDQLPGRPAVVASLDTAPTGAGATPEDTVAAPPAAQTVEERQVVASIAPFYRESERDATVAPPLQAAVTPEPATALRIEFVGPSWVEVLGRDGKRLAFGLVAAGEAHSFPMQDVSSVSIGDADAVDVSLGGAELDLAPFRRAKVARFTLSSDGKLNAAGG
jgi:cytoskeleton protein RodZ